MVEKSCEKSDFDLLFKRYFTLMTGILLPYQFCFF